MRTRPVRADDIPKLKEIHQQAGYDFAFPDLFAPNHMGATVVVDDFDQPMMCVVAKKAAEVMLLCAPGGNIHPELKMTGIGLLHLAMRDELVKRGYDEAFAFIPPELEANYARHLRRRFGWVKTWAAYAVRDWKV